MRKIRSSLENSALEELVGLLDEPVPVGTRLRRVINEELTPRQRELIELYYRDEMSMTEIADMLGISKSTVSRTISRGKGRIRKCLKYNGRSVLNEFGD